jgi:hypothetical protein
MKLRQFEMLADFIQRHNMSNGWPHKDVRDWLIWANEHGFLLTVSVDAGKVIGLMVARPVSQLPVSDNVGEFDENGKIIWIDICIAPSKDVWKALGCLAVQRFGYRSRIASQRWGGPIKLHDYDTARRALLR